MAAKTCLEEFIRAQYHRGLAVGSGSSLGCLTRARQSPWARKRASSRHLRLNITPLDTNSITSGIAANIRGALIRQQYQATGQEAGEQETSESRGGRSGARLHRATPCLRKTMARLCSSAPQPDVVNATDGAEIGGSSSLSVSAGGSGSSAGNDGICHASCQKRRAEQLDSRDKQPPSNRRLFPSGRRVNLSEPTREREPHPCPPTCRLFVRVSYGFLFCFVSGCGVRPWLLTDDP